LIGTAKTSSHILHGIINDILDYAKMEAGKIDIIIDDFDIRSLVEEVVSIGQSLLGDKKLQVDFDIMDSVPARVLGDEARLRQIVLNLVSNAIKFTDSGFVRVRVYPLLEQEVQGKPGHLMRFEVHDTGVGISAEDQAKLFQEFSQVEQSYTRRHSGTGLGLAICRRLVGLMGGEIDVESQSGKGSRFWFIVPLATATEQRVTVEERPKPKTDTSNDMKAGLSSFKLLLVEDNDTNRLVARRYIEKMGLGVDEAVNGQVAVDKARETKYDIIFMDVSMPIMDGMTATRTIRTLDSYNATVPIIALTAHAMEGDKQACLAAGMNDYLLKPIEENQMLRVFRDWLTVGNGEEHVSSGSTASPEDYEPNPFQEIELDFDRSVLLRMRDDLGGDVVDHVTRTYLADSAIRMERLTLEAELKEIRDIAHTIKSSSGNCGLKLLSKKMAELELAAASLDQNAVQRLLPEARQAYVEAREALEKEKGAYVE
jgi:CheY-like chemotaxis protein